MIFLVLILVNLKFCFLTMIKLSTRGKGELRMCIDYRELNKITIFDKHPLPRTDDLLSNLVDAKYYVTLDFKSGFW